MTPVRQTRFHDPATGTKGNCLRAALASVMDLRLEDVPPFEDMGAHEWLEEMINFIQGRGYVFDQLHPPDAPEGYCIANGMSPRGVPHSVVYKDGRLAHDPHPSGAGITGVREYWTIKPSQAARGLKSYERLRGGDLSELRRLKCRS